MENWPGTGASARGGGSSRQPGHGRDRPIPQAPHDAGASCEWLVGGDGRSEGLGMTLLFGQQTRADIGIS